MLREILFDIAPELLESPAVKDLLNELSLHEINYVFSSKTEPTCAALLQALAQPSGDCLMLTASAAGIAFARKTGLASIGYAPPEGTEDMSGAYALFEDFSSIDAAYLCRTHAHAMGYPADILSTERLLVRELSEEDFPALYAMCTESSTAFFMEETLSDYDTEFEKHAAYLRTVYPFFDLALWGVYEKSSGKLIGRAGFSLPEDESDTFSIGYLIDVPYRRCGYAKVLIPALLSYAKEQGYTEISAQIKKDNIPSVKALEQCGYPYECTEDAGKETLNFLIYLTA